MVKAKHWYEYKSKDKRKKWLSKWLFQVVEYWSFGKALETVRMHGDVELVTTERRRKSLLSGRNYHEEK